jgi:hypothetical protein
MAGDTDGWHGASLGIWFAVLVTIAGTIVAGIALIEWNWIAFWIGIGAFIAGCVGCWALGVMDAVTEFGPAPEH